MSFTEKGTSNCREQDNPDLSLAIMAEQTEDLSSSKMWEVERDCNDLSESLVTFIIILYIFAGEIYLFQ